MYNQHRITNIGLANLAIASIRIANMGENPLRCTTHDEKGPVLIVIIFYLIFDPHKKIMNQKLSKNLEGLYFRLLQF